MRGAPDDGGRATGRGAARALHSPLERGAGASTAASTGGIARWAAVERGSNGWSIDSSATEPGRRSWVDSSIDGSDTSVGASMVAVPGEGRDSSTSTPSISGSVSVVPERPPPASTSSGGTVSPRGGGALCRPGRGGGSSGGGASSPGGGPNPRRGGSSWIDAALEREEACAGGEVRLGRGD